MWANLVGWKRSPGMILGYRLFSLLALLSSVEPTRLSDQGPAPPPSDTGLAPDGERSLGAGAKLSEVLECLRSRRPADHEFVAGLESLEASLSILAETAEALYRSRGLFEVLDPREAGGLSFFHQRVQELWKAPEPFLVLRDKRGGLWARILCDTRLRIRSELFSSWEDDAREVRDGLALLRGNDDGWVRLDEEEVRLVVQRVDLAAALLRARLKDLAALREAPGEAAEVEEQEVARILAALELPAGERAAALAIEYRRLEERAAAMRELLFFVRFTRQSEGWVAWRAELERRAGALRAEVRVLRPDTPEGRDAPREIQNRKKTSRRREAFARATLGLAHDPFDAELAFSAAQMAEYVGGALESVDYYDRFLVLRGIRVHDDRTWRKRVLTDEENHALFQIQQFESGLSPLPGAREE